MPGLDAPREPTWWDEIDLSSQERDALRLAGYGGRSAIGQRPVLLVVDATVGFFGPADLDLIDAVASHPLASGPSAWRSAPRIRHVVAAARETGLPIVFTRPAPPSRRASTSSERWRDKNARHDEPVADEHQLVAEVGYRPSDLLLEKEAPSAFHGTPLARWLTGWGADGVIVCGGTTSGCVRATVVDAFSANLVATVVADGCFDRVDVSHRVGLFDMDLKYADVQHADEVAARIRARPDDVPMSAGVEGARTDDLASPEPTPEAVHGTAAQKEPQ